MRARTGHAIHRALTADFGRKRFGDEGYAMEELVAELGAAFLCAGLELTPEPREEHASYIESWLTALRDDKRAIFHAAAHAQRAADFLRSCSPGLCLKPSCLSLRCRRLSLTTFPLRPRLLISAALHGPRAGAVFFCLPKLTAKKQREARATRLDGR